MQIPIQKLKAMITFFATCTDPQLLGKVKLMKLFYFADFLHVKRYASPITFDRYAHLEHGPIPSTILHLINQLENDPDNSIISDAASVEKKEGSPLKRIVAREELTENDRNLFSTSELEILDEVCERFKEKNTRFIEDASHKEAAWMNTKELQDIPYTLAANDLDCVTTKEEIDLVLSIFA